MTSPFLDNIKAEIGHLVDKYHQEGVSARRQKSEADVRADYIDLLFKALGWNVYNDAGHRTNYRREGYIRDAGFIDVGLEIDNAPVLLVEAKRFDRLPHSNDRIGDRTPAERQAFRYARGRGIPYAIVTNFERFHVFNADHERLILAFDTPDEYIEHTDELIRLTPGEIQAGSLPWWEGQFHKDEVDHHFLESLRKWRYGLANSIYAHNQDNPVLLTKGVFDLSLLLGVVQRILDRLILIQFADDHEVLLSHGQLDNLLTDYRSRGPYARPDYLIREFTDLSNMMDQHHNTTIFAPGHPCEAVFIPNSAISEVLQDIISISFRKFSSDILGATYESYLGTRLVLRDGTIVEESRRDIRKAQGIFYTPTHIVHKIVDETLGKYLDQVLDTYGIHAITHIKTLSVLDPACGSGSFLIYAYRVLAAFYSRLNADIEAEQQRLTADLTESPDMFKRFELLNQLPQPVPDFPHAILQTHLFGVDIDPQAAEIAAVNLTMQALVDSRQKKLPLILNENIKVGDSLISPADADLNQYFGNAHVERVPFDWNKEFPGILSQGGFDIIIGNPPYLFGEYIDVSAKEFFKASYQVSRGQFDEYWLFYERCLSLLAPYGLHGYIVPDALLARDEARVVRSLLLTQCTLKALIHTPNAFSHGVSTVVTLLKKGADDSQFVSRETMSADTTTNLEPIRQQRFSQHYNKSFLLYAPDWWYELIERIQNSTVQLDKLGIRLSRGEELGKRDLVLLANSGNDANGTNVPILVGEDIQRYGQLSPKFGVSKEHIKKNPASYKPPKIVVVKTGNHLVSTLDQEGYVTLQSVYNVSFSSTSPTSPEYILAIMNSSFIRAWIWFEVTSNKKLFPQLNQGHLAALPIPEKSKPEVVTQIHELVGEALSAGFLGPSADTSIESLLQESYGITAEEYQRIINAVGN